jgi:hypothetical protein
MNTQAERLTSRRDARVSGFTYLKKLAAWVELKREAYRAHRHEMELRDALRALSPELLKDIGVALDATGDALLDLATRNPHVIVSNILDQPPRYHDPS